MSISLDAVKMSLNSTSMLIRKIYRKYGPFMKLTPTRVPDSENVGELHFAAATIKSDSNRNSLEYELSDKVIEILNKYENNRVQRAYKTALRGPNEDQLRVLSTNILAACSGCISFMISQLYLIDINANGEQIISRIKSKTLSKRDIQDVSHVAAVDHFGKLSNSETVELIEQLGSETRKENGLAVGATYTVLVISGLYLMKLLPYFYFYSRITVSDQMKYISMFLKNSAALISDKKIADRQKNWSEWFEKMSDRIDIEDRKISKDAAQEVEFETRDMENDTSNNDDDSIML